MTPEELAVRVVRENGLTPGSSFTAPLQESIVRAIAELGTAKAYHTYVLCCDELPERKKQCEEHLRSRDVPYTVWRGFHGRTWGLRTEKEFDPGRCISPGHVGLNLGHWALWQHVYHAHPDPNFIACVFEDDVLLPPTWNIRVGECVRELDAAVPDWQFCFVGLAETEPHVWHKVTERIGGGDSRLCRIDNPFGTHAYLVKTSALPTLLDRMTIVERNMDQQLFQRVLKDNHIKWCAYLPTIVKQRTFDYANQGKPEWSASTLDPVFRDEVVPPPPSEKFQAVRADPKDFAANVPDASFEATSKLIDPFPCIYRGEYLVDDGWSTRGKVIPLEQCAFFGEPCHTRDESRVGTVRTNRGEETLKCKSCTKRKDMGAPGAARDRLPVPDGHFNPSLHRYGDRLVLATRDSWGHSRVSLWDMVNSSPDWSGTWSVSHIGSYASEHPDAPRLEDPRLFAKTDADGRVTLCCAFNLPDGYPPKRVRVGYSEFHSDLSGIARTVVYESPRSSLYEKNWSPFFTDGRVHWVYGMKPQHEIRVDVNVPVSGNSLLHTDHRVTTANNFPWTGGAMRGGAAPALLNGEYYTFFHGCLKRVQGNVYTAGCYTFSPKPPYRVLRQTTVPILWPDLPAPGESVTKRYVCWVGGAVYHAAHWHLAIGVDDTFCRIVRIPHVNLAESLLDVEETDSLKTVSIRDTAVSLGVRADY